MHVGITGHQRLKDSDAWTWVATVICAELAKLLPPVVAVTSLAIGADQIFAQLVLDQGGRIHAVLPFADIERSFTPKDLPRYRQLVNQATVEVLNIPGTDEDAYFAAGRRVVDLSDLVLAVWDGEPAKGKGGTGDIVAYARSQRVPMIRIDPVAHSIEVCK
jgi:hypothetical protein